MKIKYGISIITGFFLFWILLFISKNSKDFRAIERPPAMDFDSSMLLSQFPQALERNDFKLVYKVFKTQYNNYAPDIIEPDKDTRIPKIIHVMWLGGKLPAEYVKYVESWKKMHPHWTILFWTDSHMNDAQGIERYTAFDDLEKRLKTAKGGERIVIDARSLVFDNKKFYDKAINYGEKSDILKWEIVYRFGGVYVDTDFECLKPLDAYHHMYDFYTGIQPLDTFAVQLGAALYGAIPHHPILKVCVETIKNNQAINQIVVKTGPIHFTKVCVHMLGKTGLRDIVLPAGYLYPCGYEERGTPRDQWCKVESYAVHHWAGSWLKPEAFVRV